VIGTPAVRRRSRRWAIGALAAACVPATGGCGGDEPKRPITQPRPETRAVAPKPALARNPGGPKVATVARGLEAPWEIAFLPDRRALVTERPGRVRLMLADRRLLPDPVADVSVSQRGEDGLLGLAVDPEFSRNRFVYLYRTTGDENQVVRYRLDGERLREQAVIVDSIPAAPVHDGGRIHFGPDRQLYVSTGESGNPDLAQDRGSLGGKFLRLSPEDYRGGSARPEVYSFGHRNPQGFDWEPGTGRLVATEHGPTGGDGPRGFDEVNLIRRGANYGWPRVFGDRSPPGLTAPAVVYENAIAPSGGTFVSLPGSAWTGDFLFGALVGEQMRRVCFAGGRVSCNQALFEGDFGRLRTVVEGPEGALYALTTNRDGRGSPRDGDDRVLRIVPPAG
jgi:glucose/arabinose dehydrogenase